MNLLPGGAGSLVRCRAVFVAVFASLVAACGGGGGGNDAPPPAPVNQPPTVDAGVDQNVQQSGTVTLSGTASDDGGAAGLTFAWSQIDGPAVALTGADAQTATFTAPATADFVVLQFRLTVSDGANSRSDEVIVTVFNDTTAPSVSGTVRYEFVPFAGNRLDYQSVEARPVRAATVQLVDAGTGNVLQETVLGDDGRFLLPAPSGTDLFVRVRAELKRSGLPAWDVEVRDNTSATTLPLEQRPLYVLDGQVFNSGSGPQNVQLLARTGWGGSSYTGTRASAPFAILDTIYTAISLVRSVDPDVTFPPLDAFWSVNNTPTITSQRNLDNGELGTSFYRSDLDSLFLLGAQDVDTEEFDTHVVAHEWGHYFEDVLSRSDSIGGRHSLLDRLDPRLAFGEGFGNAVSAMIMGSPIYFDTQGSGQGSGFTINVDDNANTSITRGWYNERSIQAFLYDVFDDDIEVGDDIALGFAPIYEVLVNEQANGVPFTTIYPFVEALRNRAPSDLTAIDLLLVAQRINPDDDAYGSAETEDANGGSDVLPIYTVVTPGGPAVNVCSTARYDPDDDGNKLSIRRLVRFTVPSPGDYTFDIQTTNPPAIGASDPDAVVFQVGFVGLGFSAVPDRETFSLSLAAGDHVMEVYEFSYLRDDPPSIDQPGDRTCFDITISP